jgi:hypothetical protein
MTRIPSGHPDRSNRSVISTTSACSPTSPSAVTAGVHTFAGSWAIALVTAVFLVGKPTEYSTRRPRSWLRPAMLRGDLCDRSAQHLDVVTGMIAARVAGPQHDRE